MHGATAQRLLDKARVAAFHHDDFVTTQVGDFAEMMGDSVGPDARIVDIGGGVGRFASALAARFGCTARLVDVDAESVRQACLRGVDAELGDALTTRAADGAHVATLNLILHHLVGSGSAATKALQQQALVNLRNKDGPARLFVNEYIYESFAVEGYGAAMIYGVTSSRVLSGIAGTIAAVVPSLRANTFGIGVRFRSRAGWAGIFARAGWRIVREKRGPAETISLPRRLAFALRSIRRDSFVLERA